MRATISVLNMPSQLTSATAVEPTAFTAYDAGTAYAFGDIRSVAADFANYEYLQPYDVTVVGKTPLTSPLWWRQIGPTETAFDPAKTTYALGETAYSAVTHHCYQSLVLQTVAHPLPVLPDTTTAFWFDLGMTNKYATLDLDRNTQTVYPSPHTWVITPGSRANTVGLTGMVGNTLLIKVTSVARGGTIYPLAYDPLHSYEKYECMTVGLATCYQSIAGGNVGNMLPDDIPDPAWWTPVLGAMFDLNTRQVFNATDYYFNPISTRPTKVVFDVPAVTDGIITIKLSAGSGNVKCGSIVTGLYIYLGKWLKPSSNKGKGFSTITRDLWGNATIVKRRMLPVMTGVSMLDSFRIDSAIAARNILDAVPALYTGVEEDGDWTDMFTIIGVHQQFDIGTNDSVDYATLTFQAEEI